MSKSRRRTLSHLEVENFLNEISTKKITENDVNNVQQQSNLKNINDVMKRNGTATIKYVAPPDDAQLIRDYCKIKCSGKVHDIFQWEAMRNLSKTIHDKTTYKLMSERLMLPERFYHPIGSVENRKEILLGLTPMLTDADIQRKQEVDACESFTKCRSSRVRARNTYEYIDMETTKAIDFVDYERRYIQYITETKNNRQQNYALQLQPSSFVSLSSSQSFEVDNKENFPIQSLSTALNSVAKIAKKRKQVTAVFGIHEEQENAAVKSNVNRRETLSPGTVRKLLIEKVESVMSPTTDANRNSSISNFPTAPSEDINSEIESVSIEIDHKLPGSVTSPVVDIDIDSFDNEFVPSPTLESTVHCGKKRANRGGARRNTLSPSAARMITMEILSEESECSIADSDDSKVDVFFFENVENAAISLDNANLVVGETELEQQIASVVSMHVSGIENDLTNEQTMNEVEGEEICVIVKNDERHCYENNQEICSDNTIAQFLTPMEIPQDSDEAVISLAVGVNDMVGASPTRRFFGRKSEGNIVSHGLKILDGSETDLAAFELLESFVSGILATAIETESPHFFSPQRDSKVPISTSKSSPIHSSIINLVPGPLSSLKEKVGETSLSFVLPAYEINEEEWEKRASQRMRQRFAMARWQYLWEIVSAQAANKAIHEARKKQKLNS